MPTTPPIQAFIGGPLSPDEEAERLADGQAFAWRLSLAAARERLGGFADLTWVEEIADPGVKTATPETLGDMVLGRKDIGAGYTVASVVDDALQGVTHVIRGEDLIETTSIQRLLQALLGLPTPTYGHHRLLLGPDGKRYAKRDGAVTLRALREAGVTAHALRADLGF